MKKIKLILIITLLALLALSGFFLFENVYSFLAITSRTDADILVIEGWVSDKALQQAVQEYQQHPYQKIIIASTPVPVLFTRYATGKLTFDLTRQPAIGSEDIKEIALIAFSNSSDSTYPAFRLLANDTLIGEASASAALTSYTFALPDLSETIAEISVQIKEDTGQTALYDSIYVHSILVDDHLVHGWARSVSYYKDKRSRKDLIWTQQFKDAEIAREILLQKGIPDSAMVALHAPEVHLNRTYNSAMAVSRWMSENYIAFPSINVLSEGTHARRTRMLYHLAFQGHDIGVIASPSADFNAKNWWKVKEGRQYVLEQLLKYLYVKFLFYPSLKIQQIDIIIKNPLKAV